MSLENLTGSDKFINALVVSNPEPADDRYEGDNHIRGVKNVLVNSFGKITGNVNASHSELNGLVGYATGKGSVEARLTATEAHVTQTVPSVHWDDAPAGGGVYARIRGSWTLVAGTTDSLDIITAGRTDQVDLDLNYFQDAANILAFTNDRLSYNILGSVAGREIFLKINGVLQPLAIAKVGQNGQAHGWLSAEVIADIMGWRADPAYVRSVSVVFVEVDGGSSQDITPAKTVQITRTTTQGDPGVTPNVLEVDTAGSANRVDLDLVVYNSAGSPLAVIENRVMSWNVLGMGPNRLIKASVNGNILPQIAARSGTNGSAHGWFSAAVIWDARGFPLTHPDGVYDIAVALIDGGTDGSGTALIPESKVVRITKRTIDAPTFGGPAEQVIWGWNQGNAISLFYSDVRDSPDGQDTRYYTGAEECSVSVLNSTPNAAVELRRAGSAGPIATLSDTNIEGNAFGSVGAHTLWGFNSFNFGNVTVELRVGGIVKSTRTFNVVPETLGSRPL